jgi:GDP-mannose transporter
MASQHGNGPTEEKDVAEMKKAIATGASTKEASLSARESHFTLEILNNNDIWSTVPPILCYCCASILMTVVNKVLL